MKSFPAQVWQIGVGFNVTADKSNVFFVEENLIRKKSWSSGLSTLFNMSCCSERWCVSEPSCEVKSSLSCGCFWSPAAPEETSVCLSAERFQWETQSPSVYQSSVAVFGDVCSWVSDSLTGWCRFEGWYRKHLLWFQQVWGLKLHHFYFSPCSQRNFNSFAVRCADSR